MGTILGRCIEDDVGQDLIEYALLAALLAVALVLVLGQLAGGTNNLFTKVLSALT